MTRDQRKGGGGGGERERGIIESCSHHRSAPARLFATIPPPPWSPIPLPSARFPPRRSRNFYARFGKARVSFALKQPAFYPSGAAGVGARRGSVRCSGRAGVATEDEE